MEVIARINIDSPTGRKLLREVEKHPEVAKIEQIDPRTINPPSEKTHAEIWEQLEQKLNLHFGTKLKLKY